MKQIGESYEGAAERIIADILRMKGVLEFSTSESTTEFDEYPAEGDIMTVCQRVCIPAKFGAHIKDEQFPRYGLGQSGSGTYRNFKWEPAADCMSAISGRSSELGEQIKLQEFSTLKPWTEDKVKELLAESNFKSESGSEPSGEQVALLTQGLTMGKCDVVRHKSTNQLCRRVNMFIFEIRHGDFYLVEKQEDKEKTGKRSCSNTTWRWPAIKLADDDIFNARLKMVCDVLQLPEQAMRLNASKMQKTVERKDSEDKVGVGTVYFKNFIPADLTLIAEQRFRLGKVPPVDRGKTGAALLRVSTNMSRFHRGVSGPTTPASPDAGSRPRPRASSGVIISGRSAAGASPLPTSHRHLRSSSGMELPHEDERSASHTHPKARGSQTVPVRQPVRSGPPNITT